MVIDNKNNNTEEGEKRFLTLQNVKYLVEGLEVLLQTNVDGEKRSRVIKLRDDLINYSGSFFNDFT